MRPRRFRAGDEFEAGGVRFRCTAGHKGPGDVRLDWCINGRYEPVLCDALLAAFDCIAENEDVLYPHPNRGGEEVLRYFKIARISGWREATRLLYLARVAKVNRSEEGMYAEEVGNE